jgi:K+-transporting ATPase KdpF subunit
MIFGDILSGLVSIGLLGWLAFALTRREPF